MSNIQPIPLGLKWRVGINSPEFQRTPFGDPGAEIVRAFNNNLVRRPHVALPGHKMSKQEKYTRDLMNNLAPIPTFGVEDTTPETPGELQAMYNPQFIVDSVPVGSVQGIDRHSYVSYGMILE